MLAQAAAAGRIALILRFLIESQLAHGTWSRRLADKSLCNADDLVTIPHIEQDRAGVDVVAKAAFGSQLNEWQLMMSVRSSANDGNWGAELTPIAATNQLRVPPAGGDMPIRCLTPNLDRTILARPSANRLR